METAAAAVRREFGRLKSKGRGNCVENERETEEQRIEREIRSRRGFSLAEAVGREGASTLKGESPIAKQKQLQLAMTRLVETHLRDGEMALSICLIRRARAAAATAEPVELTGPAPGAMTSSPSAALRRVVDFLLQNEARLQDFVNEVDAEWGRLHRERPYFDRPGVPSDSDDPYPLEGVRASLERFLDVLGREEKR